MLEPVGLTLLFLKTVEGGPKEALKYPLTAPLGDVGTAFDVATNLGGRSIGSSNPQSSGGGGFLSSLGSCFVDCEEDD